MDVQRLPLRRNRSGKQTKTKRGFDDLLYKLLINSHFSIRLIFGVFEANKLFVGKNCHHDAMFVKLFRCILTKKELPVSNHLSLQRIKNTHTNEK